MNRLREESSPHLQQHADNPVEWYPWGEEALALAKSENKPILLSIGYSACHWCQQMGQESFQSNQVAKLMNDNFVNIKVDREERPDLDRIYQTAHGILTRNPGGWPLTLFLDPHDQLPFFGGTYFPPQGREDSPGFRDVLRGMAKTFENQYEKIQEFKPQLQDALTKTLGGGEPGDLDDTLVERACGQIDASFDVEFGGFSGAPKFPHPVGLELLLDVGHSLDDSMKTDRVLHMLDFSLSAMSRGGLQDHIGGGFFGFSVDTEWSIPHFEKMLFDNGMLLSLYAKRAKQTGSTWFADVANRSADALVRDFQLPSGGFAASFSADLNAREGDYYTWFRDEINDTLGEDYDAFSAAFTLSNRANFGVRWHLRLPAPAPNEPALDENPVAGVEALRDTLFAKRSNGEQPTRDEKVICAWNALAIRGLIDASVELDQPKRIDDAIRAVDYLRTTHMVDGRLCAVSLDGKPKADGYLDDYAFLLDALLALLAVRWRDADLDFAIELADAMLVNFADEENGGFFFTAHDHAPLPQRTKTFNDDSLPSGNGVAARALLELGSILGESRYLDAAEKAIRAGMTDASGWPSAHASLLRGLLAKIISPRRVLLHHDDPQTAQEWIEVAAELLSPRERCYNIPAGSKPKGIELVTGATICMGVERTHADSVEKFAAAVR